MKLIGKLKDNVAKAETKEEARQIIKDAGMELNDDELEQVSGGIDGAYKMYCSLSFQKEAPKPAFVDPPILEMPIQ